MTKRPSHPEKGSLPIIVWDGLGLSAQYSGIGVYGQSLFNSLNDLGCMPHVAALDGEMPPYVPEAQQLKVRSFENKFLSKVQKLKPCYPLWTYGACKETWPNSGVIFHGLSNLNLPLLRSKRSDDRFVVTIHDMISLNLEDVTALSLQLMSVLPRVIARADKIITGSYWTKIQLLERFGSGLSDKIFNLGYGTNVPADLGREWSLRAIDGLAIGRGESYKRLEMFVNMAERMPEKRFVLVTNEQGRRRVKTPLPNLEVISNISTTQLEVLYANSKVFVHPSLYEGWCLPAADALARGLQLLYCRGSGIDEVAGFGKKLAKGLNREAPLDDWVAGFLSLVSKEPPKGEQPMLPSWLEIAQKTLKIYESLL
jgi:glycosyltransferase involved in cell wall biosynthesis